MVSVILPSPSTVVSNLYFINTKFATTFLLSSITTSVDLDVPEASPDQLSKVYSSPGAAFKVTVVPSL